MSVVTINTHSPTDFLNQIPQVSIRFVKISLELVASYCLVLLEAEKGQEGKAKNHVSILLIKLLLP